MSTPPRRSGDLAEARTLLRQAREWRAEDLTRPERWQAVAHAQDRLAALLLATYPLPRRRGHRRQR